MSWVVAFSVGAAVGCGSNPGNGLSPAPPPGCNYAGVDPKCGAACTADADCGDTLFCNMGKCAAQGTTNQPCPAGYALANGRCLAIGGTNPSGCTNLQCKQVDCTPAGTGPTTLTGRVFAPNGTLPLYNVIVYVPNAPVATFKDGVACDACGAVQSGSPVVATITDTSGNFSLTNVPFGDNIPLVVQVGRWRRQLTIPKVRSCTTAQVANAETRLPKNKGEGDIPKMAIATGNADPFECLLTKIGVQQEMTRPTENGRIHYFRANGVNMNPPAPDPNGPAGTGLWNSLDTLKQYDVVMLPCEGGGPAPQGPTLANKNDAALGNIVQYANAGGRVFVTHYSYVWLTRLTSNAPDGPFPGVATWNLDPDSSQAPGVPFYGTINTTFPKGMAFRQWLGNVDALVKTGANNGKLDIQDPRRDVTSVIDPPSKRWVYSDTMGQPAIDQHFTFNTPLAGGVQCGRVVFSDFHVSAAAKTTQPNFPASCKTGDLSPQEKALAFMLFDLSACVQDDDLPVDPPIP